jgi:hypothetical protein
MVIFHSYVSLPEGTPYIVHIKLPADFRGSSSLRNLWKIRPREAPVGPPTSRHRSHQRLLPQENRIPWTSLVNHHLEVSIVMGVPLYRWMVDFMENPNLKWMMTGDTPILGNPHLFIMMTRSTWCCNVHDTRCLGPCRAQRVCGEAHG